MQLADVSNMTPRQLCDFLRQQIDVEAAKTKGEELGFPESFLEQLPPELLVKEIAMRLLDDPESLAFLCRTNKYFLQTCKEIKVPGVEGEVNVWDYARKESTKKCLLYQWLAFIAKRSKHRGPDMSDFLPAYRDATIDQLYKYVDIIQEGGILVRFHMPVIPIVCNFEDFESLPMASRLVTQQNILIPLYSTQCEYDISPIWVADLPIPGFPILARFHSMYLSKRNMRAFFDTIRSKEFEDVVLRELREKYDPISADIRKAEKIPSTCARLWLPDLVHINWYVVPSFSGPFVHLYYAPFESDEIRKQ
jgi:hypothetical protein